MQIPSIYHIEDPDLVRELREAPGIRYLQTIEGGLFDRKYLSDPAYSEALVIFSGQIATLVVRAQPLIEEYALLSVLFINPTNTQVALVSRTDALWVLIQSLEKNPAPLHSHMNRATAEQTITDLVTKYAINYWDAMILRDAALTLYGG